jgi:hypothetical protein
MRIFSAPAGISIVSMAIDCEKLLHFSKGKPLALRERGPVQLANCHSDYPAILWKEHPLALWGRGRGEGAAVCGDLPPVSKVAELPHPGPLPEGEGEFDQAVGVRDHFLFRSYKSGVRESFRFTR